MSDQTENQTPEAMKVNILILERKKNFDALKYTISIGSRQGIVLVGEKVAIQRINILCEYFLQID